MTADAASLWWVVPITSLLSASVGAGGAFSGLVWRYRADYRREIVTQLLADIQAAADLATDYWILDPASGLADVVRNEQAISAKLIGFMERIGTSIEAARPHLRAIDTLGMEIPWAEFLDKAQGGQFADPMRPSDLARATGVQYAAAVLIEDLRLAANARIFGRAS